MTRRPELAAGALIVVALCTGCTVGAPRPVATPEASTNPAAGAPTTATATATPSRSDAIREWEKVARKHFTESADALKQVSEASAAEDEAGLREGCVRLHDTNTLGLQKDLPSPDPKLTAELQRMIDDMNVATHACLRFALGRNAVDADTYQQYLARAVEHLQRAKVILNAAER